MKPHFVKNYYSKMFGGIWDRKLFTWKELETLINIRPLMTTKRVWILGSSDEYEWVTSGWSLDNNCYPPSLLKNLLDTYACYLSDMSRSTKKINDVANHLEEEYNLDSDAHIYISRRIDIDHPFGIHFDKNHNVIIQCEGQTNFKVWNEFTGDVVTAFKNGMNTRLTMSNEPILDVDMRPGDAIWIPKYYPHLATSKTQRMSVSFPLKYGLKQPREWIEL